MNIKANQFKNLKDNEMLSELLGVDVDELTDEQRIANEIVKLVEEFKKYDPTNENADDLLSNIKKAIQNKLDINLTPSTEENIIADGGNSRTNKKESKSKRTNLLFRPTAYNDLQKLAIIKQTSVNDLMNIIAENVVEENAEVLEAYDKLNKLMK